MFQTLLQLYADMRHAAMVEMIRPYVDESTFMSWQAVSPVPVLVGVM